MIFAWSELEFKKYLMKLRSIIFLIISLQSISVSSQNIILPEGEFIDTTNIIDATCKGHHYVYYYQVGGKYPENSRSLLSKAQAFMHDKNKSYHGSGYITLRFAIDCEGKMGRKVQVLQTNEKYKSFHFDKKFVNELHSFLKTLDKWKIAGSKESSPFFYTSFITFKIKDGKIINIIP